MRAASDGNCYFACSSHSPDHGCAFFRFDPRTNELELLCEDITTICGEDPKRTPPQGKVRSDMVEVDGWLYFGTHLANYWLVAEAAYTGGHVVGYRLGTREFRDYGVMHQNHTIYSGLALDPARRRLYVYVTPYPALIGAHLYRIDLKSGMKEDLGIAHPGKGVAYYLFVDQSGDCWFAPRGEGGALFRARGTDGKIDRWENLLPQTYSWQKVKNKTADPERCMRWMQSLPDGCQCVFTMETSEGESGDMLWLLDTSKETKEAVIPLERIGPTGFGLTVNRGRIYYVQNGYAKPFQRSGVRLVQWMVAKTVAKLISLQQYPELHLRSLTLDGPSMIDHGLIVDQDGRKPMRIDSLAADGNGRIFMIGDWQLLPGEKGLLLYDHQKGRYIEHPVGEFFAVGQANDDS